MVTTVRGTDNLFLIVWKYLTFSQFFRFHVISKQLLCHLPRHFCVLWFLVFNYFFRCLARSTKQTWKSRFCFFTDGKQHKARERDMITLGNYSPRPYMTWLPVALSVLGMKLYNLQLDDVPGADFENSLYAFGQSEKR